MAIFRNFFLIKAQSMGRKGSPLKKNGERKKSTLNVLGDSSLMHYHTIDHFNIVNHHHHSIRRLVGNMTVFDDTEEGTPTTVAVVCIVLFIFIISLFFLLSCFMWCFSNSGSHDDDDCDHETHLTPTERLEYLESVLETKTYVFSSEMEERCMAAPSEMASTTEFSDNKCSDVDIPSLQPVVDVTFVLASNSVDDGKRQCAICLENFMDGDLISSSSINLECRHQFHQPCIMEWCMKQSDCPCCRRDLLFLQDAITVAMDNIDSSRSDFTRSIPDAPEE